MTRVAKETMRLITERLRSVRTFVGCSDGGREALMEAQRYPADYDGILAGAPANYWTALLSTARMDTQALTLDSGEFYSCRRRFPRSRRRCYAACDGLDGVRDGILNDPRQCHFDPATIQCKAGGATTSA